MAGELNFHPIKLSELNQKSIIRKIKRPQRALQGGSLGCRSQNVNTPLQAKKTKH